MAQTEASRAEERSAYCESIRDAARLSLKRAETAAAVTGQLRVQLTFRVKKVRETRRQLAQTVRALQEASTPAADGPSVRGPYPPGPSGTGTGRASPYVRGGPNGLIRPKEGCIPEPMKTHCAIIETNGDGKPRVRLCGDLDFQNAQTVRETLRAAAWEAEDPLVLDLNELAYIDSSGLSALVSAARLAQARGQGLHLEGASPQVLYLLSATGFSRFFQVMDGELIPARSCSIRPEAKVWQHLSFTIPARTCLVKHIRLRVSEMLESLSPDGTLLDAVNLAVGEAASNAVRHGCREDERKKVRVQSATDGHTLVIEISDPGPGFDPDEIPSPELGELREGGMGIYFMRLTMDEVTYSFDEGTKVRLVKHLAVSEAIETG
jgi:serine/threonine-protein kinase RsbW